MGDESVNDGGDLRDRSPRGRRRLRSLPAVVEAPHPSTLPPAVSSRLEGQLNSMTQSLVGMNSQIVTLAGMVQQQQEVMKQAQTAFQTQQVQMDSLRAQATQLPITPRKPRDSPFNLDSKPMPSKPTPNGGLSSPFEAAAQTTSGQQAASIGVAKLVLPDGTSIP